MKTQVLTRTEILGGKKEESVKVLPMVKPAEPTQAEKITATEALIEKFKPEAPKTAEERIQSISHFEAISKRYSHLKEKANDLKMFDAGNDKINAKIILKNQAGFEFEVSNSNVIKKVRDAMETELNILLSEAENEVLTFQI